MNNERLTGTVPQKGTTTSKPSQKVRHGREKGEKSKVGTTDVGNIIDTDTSGKTTWEAFDR
ncbi:hypothetical protein RUM43_006509 [Polyplax serrata]|uniref:Uncharacterized protein n=1 Tax=Polyplax serrata TaxID=468196 RepID=A0AAN8P1F7_POLSC